MFISVYVRMRSHIPHVCTRGNSISTHSGNLILGRQHGASGWFVIECLGRMIDLAGRIPNRVSSKWASRDKDSSFIRGANVIPMRLYLWSDSPHRQITKLSFLTSESPTKLSQCEKCHCMPIAWQATQRREALWVKLTERERWRLF